MNDQDVENLATMNSNSSSELRKSITHGFSCDRDRLWKITYQNGEVAAVTDYNWEITGWSDNAPIEVKEYGGNFYYWCDKLQKDGFKVEYQEWIKLKR